MIVLYLFDELIDGLVFEDVKNYLRVDFSEDDSYISELIEISLIYVDSCVGEAYKADEKLVKLSLLLRKKLIKDMYDNKSSEVPEKTKQDRIVTTILDKLSLYSSEAQI